MQDGDVAVRRTLFRWTGLQLLDQNVVSEAVGSRGSSIGSADARAIALRLHAGRFVRGSYLTTEKFAVRVHAELFDLSSEQVPLAEATETATLEAASLDSALTRVTNRLLFRSADSTMFAEREVGTTSLPALQAFSVGWNALQQWNLAAADSEFALATHYDARFTRAPLWLALARIWEEQPQPNWEFAAEAVAAGKASLPARDQGKADALIALSKHDRPAACAIWDGLTKRDPFDFTVWYGAADCLAADKTVVPDSRSPTGWKFRSGYQSALTRFQRAFVIRPAILGALRDDAFARVRRLLWTSGTEIHLGISAPPDRHTFLSYPSLDHDTLAFIPMAYESMVAADSATMRRIPRSVGAAMQRQRELFHDIASAWSASSPRSAEAHEAVSMSLFLLGEPSAIDTLMRAKALAIGARERQRILETEVWMRVNSRCRTTRMHCTVRGRWPIP